MTNGDGYDDDHGDDHDDDHDDDDDDDQPFFSHNPLNFPLTGIDSLSPFEHKWGLRVHHLQNEHG